MTDQSPFQPGYDGSGYDGSGYDGSGRNGSGREGWGYEGPPPTAAPVPPPSYPPPSYPSAPSYGPGYQPQYLPGPYPVYPVPQSNGLAVAALICGLCGLFCVTSFVAIGLGIGGLQQARRSGVGRAMSIWGICLGAAWLLFFVGLIVIGAASSSS